VAYTATQSRNPTKAWLYQWSLAERPAEADEADRARRLLASLIARQLAAGDGRDTEADGDAPASPGTADPPGNASSSDQSPSTSHEPNPSKPSGGER
jgi:hypothetical protein